MMLKKNLWNKYRESELKKLVDNFKINYRNFLFEQDVDIFDLNPENILNFIENKNFKKVETLKKVNKFENINFYGNIISVIFLVNFFLDNEDNFSKVLGGIGLGGLIVFNSDHIIDKLNKNTDIANKQKKSIINLLNESEKSSPILNKMLKDLLNIKKELDLFEKNN